MVTFRRRMGKWEVRVRRYNNKTISKTFIQKEDAHKWARETETQIEKGLYEDLSQANTITLSDLMQTYYRDVTVTKLGHSQEKISKNLKYKDDKLAFSNPKSYAGFFHTSYSGMAKRNVMGMNGYGGQAIVIDFERSRIVVTNALHENFNYKKIVYDPIKKGK
ncbi:hypothetical protein N8779_03110 [Candidatus Pelagibacter ubique]|nr:hypothetical protein [Candidatus Pelagibacter ubique]